jgi:hypothetical protein
MLSSFAGQLGLHTDGVRRPPMASAADWRRQRSRVCIHSWIIDLFTLSNKMPVPSGPGS